MSVKTRLKEIRESRALSQNELSRLIKMSPQNIQKIEQGRASGIQFDTLEKLCDTLNCEIGDLLVREPNVS